MTAALRDEICRVGALLYARGYAHGTAGNISARTADGYLITPTDACLGTLNPARLAEVNGNGVQIGGDRASKTLALHRRIYAADPEARSVVHTHATHCVALTLAPPWSADDALPPITPYFVMKVGHVPTIPYHRPGDEGVAELVARRIETQRMRRAPIRAVLLARLGPIAWHASASLAAAVLEELEETARVWLMMPASERPAPLSDDAIDALRKQFGARW